MSSRSLEWMVAGGLAGWAAARLAGADRAAVTQGWTVPLLSFTPQAAAAAWGGALLLRGRGPRTTAALAGVALSAAVAPRAIPRRQPAAAGPVLRVLTANLRHGRAAAGALVGLARAARADVLFVQELTGPAAGRLGQDGIGEVLGHQMIRPTPHGSLGSGIYARYPLSPEPDRRPTWAASCAARMLLPDGPWVRLASLHIPAPVPPRWAGQVGRWRAELAGLPAPGGLPVILAGDFNATGDHAQFRRLLRRGYADAASQAGHGLVPTWGPEPHGRPGLFALDHVLASPGCAVLAASVHRVPGSDHRALYAELRLP